ncbi:MAG: ECF transporter S component [Sphaerochaetaceae bacterium]|nr:ECF transporter S component [Sphaerochaetaceae bacterium]
MSNGETGNKPAMRIALMAVLTAVVVVFTLLVRVPTPIKGYISLCDVVIVFSAYLFGPWVAAIAGGLGTGIADVIGGYAQWAPLSFLIHGLQGLLIAIIARSPVKGNVAADSPLIRLVIAGVVGMIVMAGGYYLAGGFLYGFEAALVEIPLNLMQSGVGVVLGIIVSRSVLKAYPPVRSLAL